MFKITRSRIAALAGAVTLALAAGACGDIFGSSELGRERERLASARARWASADVQSYELTVGRSCFCGDVGPITVTVEDGQVVSRVYTESGQPVPAERFTDLDTVEDLFEFVEAALDEDPADVNVRYDERHGFPTTAFFDFEVNVADEENGFVVHGVSWAELH